MVEVRKTAAVNRTNETLTPTGAIRGELKPGIPPGPPPPPPPPVQKPLTEADWQRSAEIEKGVTDKINGAMQNALPGMPATGRSSHGQTMPGGPYVNPYSYEDMSYGYTPKLLDDPERLNASSLGMQRYQANQAVNSGAESGYKTGLADLRSTSGLSMADRKALGQQSQRARVSGAQGAQSPFNQMQAQNLYDTEQFNIAGRQKVASSNQQIMNQYEEDKAEFERQKAEVIYKQQRDEAILQRALEAAAHSA